MHHLVYRRLSGINGVDILAVPHHGYPVGYFLQLVHAVRNVYYAYSGGLEPPYKYEQVFYLALGERGRGFVQYEYFCVFVRE